MKINYWDCEYSEANEWNCGSEEEPDYIWEYYCNHPDNQNSPGYGRCDLDNKYENEKNDCLFLDKGAE